MKITVPLQGIEYESIWNVAHKWVGINSATDISDIEHLDEKVKIRIQQITRGVMFTHLSLRRADNLLVMDSKNLFINLFVDWTVFWTIRNVYFKNQIDPEFLKLYYISRTELLKWCQEQFLALPEFWLEDNSISQIPDAWKNKPASQKEKDIAACRALAQAFWKIDPRIHPVHLAESKAFRQIAFGQVKTYPTNETLKSYFADLDPLKAERGTGRPKKTTYLLNLETGEINQSAPGVLTENSTIEEVEEI